MLSVINPVAILLSFGVSGCYNWYPVKPTELPKINGSSTRDLGASMNGAGDVIRVTEVSTTVLEQPDGTLVEVQGEAGARLTIDGGREIDFEHPVRSSIEGPNLSIASANWQETEIPLERIESAEVSELSRGKTQALITTIVLAVCGIAFAVLWTQLLSD